MVHRGLVSAVLRREALIVAGALALLAILAWIYLWLSPMPMPGAGGVWLPVYLALSVAMWFVMMVAMMVPSVAPVVLLYDRVMYAARGGRHWRTAGFLGGYFAIWAAFSAVATLIQAALIDIGFVDPMGAVGSGPMAAGLLALVAVYQFSPTKAACLDRCHSPLRFMVRRRTGPWRDLRAGAAHGAWCVGCCWGLMLLLFVGGVMNLAWVAAITIAVTIEKLAPYPKWVRLGVGAAALAASAWLALSPR